MLPPPVPSSAESSSSGSSRKRRRSEGDSAVASSASSTSRFSRRTKQKIIELGGGDQCWHCGGGSPDVAHVINRKDGSYTDYGLLTFDRLGNEQNGLPLCPSCHRAFDDVNNPGIVFLPIDLSYFVDFELKDYQNRIAMAQRTDHIPPRIVPSPEMYSEHLKRQGALSLDSDGGLYLRYTLRDYFPINADKSFIPGLGPFNEAGIWHGAPMAAIKRAFQILGDPTIEGIPECQLEQLWQLRKLYARRITTSILQRLNEHGAGTASVAFPATQEGPSVSTSSQLAYPVLTGDVRREDSHRSMNAPREDTRGPEGSGGRMLMAKQGKAHSFQRFGSAATAEMNIHRWLTMTNICVDVHRP